MAEPLRKLSRRESMSLRKREGLQVLVWPLMYRDAA